MSNDFPNHKAKFNEEAVFSPIDYVKFLERSGKTPKMEFPEAVIICYHRTLLSFIKDNHSVSQGDGVFERMMLLNEVDNNVGVLGGFGIGAPSACVFLEELIAFGVKKFISIGSAGALQKDLGIGELVICDKAIRDEGTSHHYLPPAKFSYPSKALTGKICKNADQLGLSYRVGSTWTTDAPYRETKAEVLAYQDEGVMTVEMEAAALLAVATFRNVEMASLFTVSDSLAELKWQPEFHSDETNTGLENIYKIALGAIQN